MTVLGASMGLNGMKRLPAGEFAMGSEDFYPEEAPVRRVQVEGFGSTSGP
jgi:formylglycine-generating enzyme